MAARHNVRRESPLADLNDDPIVTAAEVAELVNCSPKTVGRWAMTGALKGFRTSQPNGHWRFRRSAVLAFIAAGIPDEEGTDQRTRSDW